MTRRRVPDARATHQARRVRPLWLAGAGAVVIAILIALGARAWITRGELTRLPPLPNLAARSPAVAGHLRAAYEAARRAPASAPAVGALCTAYHADLLFDEATRCYARAAALDHDWRWDYYRALIHIELGGAAGLADSLRAIAARVPDNGVVWLRLADAEFKSGRYDEAVTAWRRARELPALPPATAEPPHHTEAPLSAYAALGLARVALARHDASAARDLLEPVTIESPGFGPAFRLLGDAYRALGREADAARAIAQASRRPAFAPFLDPLADALTRESRNSTLLLRVASEASLAVNAAWSEHLARRAVEFDPDNPEAVLKLGREVFTADRNEEALALFRRYHELVPADYLGLAQIGGCLSALGRYGEAEPYLRRALQGLDDPVTHYNLGLLLAVTDRLDEAAEEYRRALARDASYREARGNLAAVLVRQGRLDEAIRELRQLIAQDGQNAVAHANLGLVLLQQGRNREARRALSAALERDPRLGVAADALRSIAGAR